MTKPARISPKADATTLFAFLNGDGEGGRGGGGSGCWSSEDTREDDNIGRYVVRRVWVCLGETNAPFVSSRPVPRRRTANSMAQGDADRREHILCPTADGSAKPQPGLRLFRDMLVDELRAPVEGAISCIVMGHRLSSLFCPIFAFVSSSRALTRRRAAGRYLKRKSRHFVLIIHIRTYVLK